MSDTGAPGPGFFGKVRTHGDFVSRRLAAEFVTPWDESLQQGMVFSQQCFGVQWLPVYLNAPVWWFALGADVCGPFAWAGVLMPGVDRVGRYFPFTVAASLQGVEIAGWIRHAQHWFDAATRLAVSTLAADFVLERFDAELNALELEEGACEPVPWRLAVADPPELGDGLSNALPDLLAASVTPGRSVWWSEGSAAVPASLRVTHGLPDAPSFAALLDAAVPGWQSVVALTRR
ncbi:MAG TPA: type VI secretion system-associated protein TagF [Paraburkholderia sp.]|jgi:type VI secretion system protein ImpM|nr:type VI secretion system-associated protein TagF [Paraburkholderia sp.]